MERDTRIEQLMSPLLSSLHIAEYVVESQTSGQNNEIVIIRTAPPAGVELVLRLPRHPVAALELVREVKLLEGLRGRLPLPIPDPVAVNLDTPEPGQVFMGYWKLPGQPLYLPLLEKEIEVAGARDRIAAQLGAFLVALHAVPLADFDPPLPVSNDRATWEGMYAGVRSKLFPAMRPDARQQISVHFESYLEDDATSSSWEPALIHGDFGPSNILYDERTGALGGVIDWSSAGSGDPATDLAALIGPVSYGEGFADALVSSYPALAIELPRARFYLGTFALQDALFGLETGDEQAYEAGMAPYC